MKQIKVSNCRDCPFVNYDNKYGYDGCNVIYIKLDKWEQMPIDEVHKSCPLKTGGLLVELESDTIPS